MSTSPSYTVYPFQPSNEGAHYTPLPLITCHNLTDARDSAEMYQDADIVVCLEGKQQLVARRVNNVWIKPA